VVKIRGETLVDLGEGLGQEKVPKEIEVVAFRKDRVP
jgi:hypothetical protein